MALFKKAHEKVVKEKDKVLKDKITKWDVKLQFKMQEIARIIDYGQLCLAKNKPAKQYHGGHIFSRGSNGNMKFNLHGIFAQSAQSNHFNADDVLMREGIVREFGQDYLDFITGLKATPIIKYSNEDYMKFYQHACKIANRLKKEPFVRTQNQRIEERNNVMSELSIYPPEFNIYFFKT